MARHSKSVNLKLGDAWREKKKAGRPVADKPLSGPNCKLCRNLDLRKVGPAGCLKGYKLDASACNEFTDTSQERFMLGGVSGVVYQR